MLTICLSTIRVGVPYVLLSTHQPVHTKEHGCFPSTQTWISMWLCEQVISRSRGLPPVAVTLSFLAERIEMQTSLGFRIMDCPTVAQALDTLSTIPFRLPLLPQSALHTFPPFSLGEVLARSQPSLRVSATEYVHVFCAENVAKRSLSKSLVY